MKNRIIKLTSAKHSLLNNGINSVRHLFPVRSTKTDRILSSNDTYKQVIRGKRNKNKISLAALIKSKSRVAKRSTPFWDKFQKKGANNKLSKKTIKKSEYAIPTINKSFKSLSPFYIKKPYNNNLIVLGFTSPVPQTASHFEDNSSISVHDTKQKTKLKPSKIKHLKKIIKKPNKPTLEQNTDIYVATGLEEKKKTALTGVVLHLSGRLKGANEASVMKVVGKENIGIQSHNRPLHYKESRIYTKWGNIGIKIWKSRQDHNPHQLKLVRRTSNRTSNRTGAIRKKPSFKVARLKRVSSV